MILPDFVLACPATLALIARVIISRELSSASYDDAWDALEDPNAYDPSEAVGGWMRENWGKIVGASVAEEDQNLEALGLARVWARPWMPRLLSAYVEAGGVMTEACKVINRSDETVRLWRHRDKAFASALEAVERQVDDQVRAVIHNHAVEGVLEPVIGSLGDYRDGHLTGPDGKPLFIRKFDHKLLIRYAESRLPEYQRKNEGTTIHNNVSASASADASASASVISPEKLKAIQERNRLQLEKQAQRSVKQASGNN